MELTRGVLLTGISAVGILGCIISWIICAAVFPGQRRRLLDKIEKG